VPIPASAVEGNRATCPNCGKRLRIRASDARPTVPDLCSIEQETTPEGPRITIVAKNTLSEGVKSGMSLNRIVPMAFALLLLPMFFMTYRWWRVSAQELAIGLSLAVLAVSAIAIGVVIQSIGLLAAGLSLESGAGGRVLDSGGERLSHGCGRERCGVVYGGYHAVHRRARVD
jgi:hypothetical protein